MTDDRELLRQYAEQDSEAAFAELVRRHVDLVYSAALRQMSGDAHRAQEVTSMTFATLARKAGSLLRHPVLPAWLYRSTYFSAAMLKRTEARRSAHEHAAAEHHAVLGIAEAAGADWEATRPVLDAAMAELAERDREAIVLRFFANAPFGEVGRRLGLSENAARMRVDRAIEKLRARLASRGVTSTAAALGVVLTEQAVAAAPAGVTAGVMSSALVGAKAGAALGLIQLISAAKFQIAGWAAVLAVGGALVTAEQHAEAKLASQVAAQRVDNQDLTQLRSDVDAMKSRLHDLQSLQARADQAAAARQRLDAVRAKTQQLLRAPAGGDVPKGIGDLGKIYDVNQIDQEPQPTRQVRPQYPLEARQAGRGGTVTIDFVVAPDGSVRDASVVNASDAEFNGSALAAVSQWQFQAGRFKGATVPVHMQVPIVFTVNNDRRPSGPPPSEWFNVDAFNGSNDAASNVQTSRR